MEEKSNYSVSDKTVGGANRDHNQSESTLGQSKTNGLLPRHSSAGSIKSPSPIMAPPPLSDRLQEADSSDESSTTGSSTNDSARLLPAPRKQKGVDSSSTLPFPVCTPPSSSCPPPPPPPQPSICHRCHPHQSTNQKRLSSTKSPASCKTDAAHIKEVSGDDCCVHCLLACLFCELLSMCSAVEECLVCGVGGASCCDALVGCCCVEAAGEAACTDEACQAVMDCCGSSDCLEICLECCSIVFPS